jgi:hypothetical protein
MEQKPGKVKSIIVVTGWYNFNVLLQQNRVKSTEKIIANPLAYAFSVDNMQDMFSNILNADSEDETETKVTVSTEQKELNISTEMKSMGSRYLTDYETDNTVVEDLSLICDECKEQGIDIKIIIPPWLNLFYERLPDYGEYDMDEYKAVLSEHADLYDFEYEECLLNTRYDDFSDLSHFHNYTYREYADELIYGKIKYARLWKGGKVVKE